MYLKHARLPIPPHPQLIDSSKLIEIRDNQPHVRQKAFNQVRKKFCLNDFHEEELDFRKFTWHHDLKDKQIIL